MRVVNNVPPLPRKDNRKNMVKYYINAFNNILIQINILNAPFRLMRLK